MNSSSQRGRTAKRMLAAAFVLGSLAAPGAFAASTAPDATAVEFYNTASRHYFLTASAAEVALVEGGAAGAGWERTGRTFAAWSSENTAVPASAVDVYRFYLYTSNSHFYTADAGEMNWLLSLNPTNADRTQWILEGKAFRIEVPSDGVCAPGLKPIYRSYNDRASAGDSNHRISGGTEVMSAMQARGWVAERVAMCSNAADVDPLRRAASSAEAAALMPTKLSGAVDAVLAGGEFTVLGVTVDGSNARFENGTASSLRAGAVVEVEGYPANGKLVATSIGLKSADASVDAGSGAWEGYISAVTPTGAIYVNGQLVNTANAVIVGGTAASLVPGARVEVRGLIQAGVLNAVRIEVKSGGDGARHDEIATSELRGAIAGYASLAQFSINGVRVDGSRAYIEHGTQTTLANGVAVEAQGLMQGAIFIASRIEVRSAGATGDGSDPFGAATLKYQGIVASLSGGNRFDLNGQPVDASTAWFEHGAASDLRNGAMVEATGVLSAGILVASKIEFKSGSWGGDGSGAAHAEIRGGIAQITGTRQFVVNGQAVDAANAAIWGPAGAVLAVGVVVDVEGTIRGGVLFADKVEIKSGSGSGSDEGGDKVKGAISSFASVADFLVSGHRVDASGARFKHGNAGMLAAGVYVEVEGRLVSGMLLATKVDFDH